MNLSSKNNESRENIKCIYVFHLRKWTLWDIKKICKIILETKIAIWNAPSLFYSEYMKDASIAFFFLYGPFEIHW